MIRDAVLREVVSADALVALAGADLGFALSRILGVFLGDPCLQQAGPQHGQSARFVLTLTTVTSTSRLNNGNGWLPVNFTLISSGSPVPQLPTDPVHDATNYYAFSASSTGLTFEINARMESTKYNSGTGDVEANDGGNKTDVYEVGTDLAF